MKKTLLLTIALLSAPAFGQVTMIPTTLSSAQDSSTTTAVVAAATGLNSNSYSIAAKTTFLYIDGELEAVSSVNGTTLGVIRGYGGSRAASHVSGAMVFVGTSKYFGASSPGLLPSGACTRTNITALPRPEVQAQVIMDCLGGVWVAGSNVVSGQKTIPIPNTGAVLYTGVGTGSAGTAPGSTTMYCTEINLPYNKLLTGLGVLNGGTAATDKWIVALYDNSGKLLANSATAGTTASGTNVYQQIPFTSKYFAIGPNQYFGCLQGNAAGSSTVTMIKTGMQDTFLTKGQTGTTFGTLPTLTVPTTFTTAVGPYFEFY